MLLCEPSATLLFIGDSITDAGRTNHVPPYGEGYVSMVRDILNAEYPEQGLTFINTGISGNTIEGLQLRWERDCLEHKPDWLFVLIGINDAHVTQDQHREPPTRLEHFESCYADLLEKTATTLPACRTTLLTPYYLEKERKSPIYHLIQRYSDVVKRIGDRFGLDVLDTQEVFDAVLSQTNAENWSSDQVHPFPKGHQLIADLVLERLEG